VRSEVTNSRGGGVLGVGNRRMASVFAASGKLRGGSEVSKGQGAGIDAGAKHDSSRKKDDPKKRRTGFRARGAERASGGQTKGEKGVRGLRKGNRATGKGQRGYGT